MPKTSALWRGAGAVLAALFALAGCGEQDGRAPAAERSPEPNSPSGPGSREWEEPAAYAYTVTASCGERAFSGTFRVTVDGGKVSHVRGLGEAGSRPAEVRKEWAPTLGEILEEYELAREKGAYKATAAFDKKDGHPVDVNIDRERDTIDEESCYKITDYRVG